MRLVLAAVVCATSSFAMAEEPLHVAVARGVEHLLSAQEGPDNAQWPYEGVYRVGGQIPIGYRVGGTGICGSAIVRAPGYADDSLRQEAIARATAFVTGAIDHPEMAPTGLKGYDVRGWGYAYGLAFLVDLQSASIVPDGQEDAVAKAIDFYIDGIETTAFGEGGWNYSRRGNRPSPFMTSSTLLALYEAKAAGHEVDDDVVATGLDALSRGRTKTGSYVYAGANGERSNESVPGSVGRMLAAETALFLAGRSSADRVRGAVDAFIVHWEWLDKRRAQTGTHVAPYGVAPYYFYYAHYFAAQAIELLPEHERDEYRRRYRELLFSVRLADGTWNDRVFERSSAYGTAMSMMSLMMPEMDAPAGWSAE